MALRKMDKADPFFTDDDFDLLEDFLLSDKVGDDAMTVSVLDGFLTGIVVGPEMIMPSEWMPVIWGERGASFSGPDEAEEICGLVIARYNQIIFELAEKPESFEPIIMSDHTGDLLGEIWAEGFVTAIEMRPEAWKSIFESDHGAAVSLIMALASPDTLSECSHDPDEVSVMANAIAEELPITVSAIDAYWKQRRGFDADVQ